MRLFFIYGFVGEPGVDESAPCSAVVPEEVFTAQFFVFTVESESIPFLRPWLCLFSWKYVWRFKRWAPLSSFCLFYSESPFFFCCLATLSFEHRVEAVQTCCPVVPLSACSCVAHCCSVFNRVIDKLFFCWRFREWAGEEEDCFFYPAPYPSISVFLSFQFHPTCFRRVLFMTSIWK